MFAKDNNKLNDKFDLNSVISEKLRGNIFGLTLMSVDIMKRFEGFAKNPKEHK
jgi:hypothetical protein